MKTDRPATKTGKTKVKTECARCGAVPVLVVVGGEPLCDEHRMEWLAEEVEAAVNG